MTNALIKSTKASKLKMEPVNALSTGDDERILSTEIFVFAYFVFAIERYVSRLLDIVTLARSILNLCQNYSSHAELPSRTELKDIGQQLALRRMLYRLTNVR